MHVYTTKLLLKGWIDLNKIVFVYSWGFELNSTQTANIAGFIQFMYTTLLHAAEVLKDCTFKYMEIYTWYIFSWKTLHENFARVLCNLILDSLRYS